MQAIKIFVLKSRRRFKSKVKNAVEELDIKINHFRALRTKKADNLAPKGALSTIEYQVNIAFSTLKIISDTLMNKKIVLLDNYEQAR